VILAQDDHVVETLPADRADHTFGLRILPGVSGSNEHFLDGTGAA
jgi:hypothetical protein